MRSRSHTCGVKYSGPGAVRAADRLSYMGRSDKGIEVEGLVRRFKDVEAVKGIDISIGAGEIYAFLSPSEGGKSTALHMLTTHLPPTAGRTTLAGFDVARQGPKV